MRKNEQKLGSLNQEMINQFGAILEDINTKFNIIMEVLNILRERFNAFEKRLESMNSRKDKIKSLRKQKAENMILNPESGWQ